MVEKPEVAREIIQKSNVVNVAGLSLEVRLKPSRAGQISLMPEYTANLKILVLLYWADKAKNIFVFPLTNRRMDIKRYSFYEGHTDYRADPIAIAWIFGFKSLEQIEAAFEGKMYDTLTQHFTRDAVEHD